MLGPKVSVTFTIKLLKLPKFFFERHPREQRIDSLFDVLALLRVGLWMERDEKNQAENYREQMLS